jgi:hypothetical protein
MISFFQTNHKTIYAVQSEKIIPIEGISKLEWLFGNAKLVSEGEDKKQLHRAESCNGFTLEYKCC